MTPPNRDREVPLDRFFHPGTVAVIGASPRRASPTNLLYRTVRKSVEAAGGVVYAVNPRYDEIDNRPCYHSIEDVPGSLDLIVIAAGDPVETLEAALDRRPLFVMMFNAGFAESGADGARVQEKVEELVSGSESYLLGPNTTLNSFLPLDAELTGPKIGLISHSGHQGRHLWEGQKLGIPLFGWAPTGNEVDLEFADFARYFSGKPEIGAIAAYIEGFKNGQTFVAAAEYAADQRTPLVIVKVGRTEQGHSTALSHTAHLAGSDEICSGVFRQHGVVRVDALDELLHTSALLARAAPPTAPGVCVYTISGGTSAHLTDVLVAAGIEVPELSEQTQHDAPASGSRPTSASRIPVDSGGAPSGDWRGKLILETLLAGPRHRRGGRSLRRRCVPSQRGDGARHHRGSQGRRETDLRRVELADRHFGHLHRASWSSRACRCSGRSISALPRCAGISTTTPSCARRAAESEQLPAAGDDAPREAADLSRYPSGPLSEWDSKQLVGRFGVPVSVDERATTAAGAIRAAERIGYPVALKLNSAGIAHRSELGLVRTGLGDGSEVAAAYEAIMAAAPRPCVRSFTLTASWCRGWSAG